MLGCNLLKIVGMTVLLFLNTKETAIAQGDNVATVGEFSKLRVAEQSGSSYLWKIYSDKSMLNQVYSKKEIYYTGKLL